VEGAAIGLFEAKFKFLGELFGGKMDAVMAACNDEALQKSGCREGDDVCGLNLLAGLGC
jgi:hypothetical protein